VSFTSEGIALDPTLLTGAPHFTDLVRTLEAGGVFRAAGLWGSSASLLVAGVATRLETPLLILTSTDPEAESVANDLTTFGQDAFVLPARETYASGKERAHADPETVRARLELAGRLASPDTSSAPRIVVASILSLLQPLPAPGQRSGDFLNLNVGASLDTEATLELFIAGGYTRVPLAEAPGEVSLRGDILDLYPFASEEPLRIEAFDDEVESLRLFDPETQRSTSTIERISVCIAGDAGGVEDGKGERLDQLMPTGTKLVELEPLRIVDMAEGLRVQSSSHGAALIGWNEARDQLARLELASLPTRGKSFEVRSVQGLAVGMREAAAHLGEALDRVDDKAARAVVLCATEAEEHRVAELFAEEPRVSLGLGSIARGFQLRRPPLFVINHRELVGIEGAARLTGKKRIHKARALSSFFELKLHDLVVHAVHGLGRYLGLKRMPRAGGEEEHLVIEYKDDVHLFVPAAKVDLVQRYIASGSNAAVALDRIGAKSFTRRKERVEKALEDLAAELLEVQAKREMKKRQAWIEDDTSRALLEEMIASFPYTDTPDQALADTEVDADLVGGRPMDRLLCGDVGFGKTEIAIRAAFRVVAGGGQAAVLVPTTVLAAQHYRTFAARLADFPVRVETLSRYVKGARAKEIAAATARGDVDILIGTHRLLSKDVTFKRLGILIIDEEQRFGVTHKEHFKKLRSEVDILTLSATPIPRTLHMSMSGLRDISALTTPPPGRQDIETLLASSNDREAIRSALLREHNRGGQSFFLHNRVTSIDARARELAELVPECSFAVGHGQMSGTILQKVMGRFSRGEVDVLVATTIIENGIDIPRAGTILMDRAGHFGLSELHQLRGRVGRGSHKAYCYLLTDETKPMTDLAEERLKALEELNHLGSGFAISMKDLELRGAGNILGPEQSGHITSVGYDLYCRLLKKTVERMQRGGDAAVRGAPEEGLEPSEVELELGLAAFLPDDWVPSPDARLELLRSLDAIRTDEDAKEALAMLRDRYGRVPTPAKELVRQFRLREICATARITRAAWRDGLWLVEYQDRALFEEVLGASGAPVELRPQGRGRALMVSPPGLDAHKSSIWLEALLRGEARAKRISLAANIS
jgi:transcription-repair coupling factor (superfamily II helicase)